MRNVRRQFEDTVVVQVAHYPQRWTRPVMIASSRIRRRQKGAILNRWEEDGPEGDWVH
jgi:hypothetical protein